MKNSFKTAANEQLLPNRLRLAGPVVGLTLLTLGLVACGSSTGTAPQTSTAITTPSAPADASVNPDIALVPYKYDGTDHSWGAKSAGIVNTQSIVDGSNALSAQNYSSATSGWGPVEINRSNGEANGGDGNTITLNGKTYSTGLGVHAASEVNYDLNGQCTGFQTDMGVDDEVRSLGSVVFQIWADGTKLYDSGVMTGNSATQSASVDLTGKKQLKLIVTNGGDNNYYDHADWAGATLIGCKSSGTTSSWTSIASEYQSFTLAAPATVRYGVGSSWVQQNLSAGTYMCGNALFGDPAYTYAKHCEVLSTSTAAGSAIPASATITYSGPLVITQGGTYSGNWESQDPNVPAVSVQTSDPVIIENSNIRGRGDLIFGSGNRLTIRHVSGYELNPNVNGRSEGNSIVAAQVKNLDIENNYFEGTNGIYIYQYAGNFTSNETIKILRNKMKNINGRPSDGNNGYIATEGTGKHPHAIQFNQVQQIPGVEIAWNQVINEPFNSLVEENFNFYISSGTPSSPILVHDNYVQGGFNALPDTNPVYAGGGILLGDGWSTNPALSGSISAYNNQVVGTTNEGMGIAGGFNNKIYNNRVISSGLLPDGRKILAANVGIYMWDHLSNNLSYPGVFGNNVMANNYSAWNKYSSGGVLLNSFWGQDCSIDGNTCSGNSSGPLATLDDEKNEYQSWINKLSNNNVTIGN